ncbi:aminoglycoside phosphotransferase family protein [Nonomuraea sp. NPDC050663]|uniref:aminoglycoside phosphotransferase family protein n=1 Tax=Nonomuraea sp. NPDC050663 TaxID=3364370 RepID=UPI0037AAE66E
METSLLYVARTLLPGVSLEAARHEQGGFHDVVLVPGVAAVRIARTGRAARELPRRTALLDRLAAQDLPFQVPVPLGPVTEVHGRTAVAVSWLDGQAHPKGSGDPAELRAVLDALAGVDLAKLDDLLGVPHTYAGGERWAEIMLEQVAPLLGGQAGERIQAALDLPAVPPGLVHGDLAGHNMHWSADGRLIGILDWDFAQPYDPAVDVACLAWHGWDTVRAAVDEETYRRARVWFMTFGLEQVAVALLEEAPEDVVAQQVERARQWMERTS